MLAVFVLTLISPAHIHIKLLFCPCLRMHIVARSQRIRLVVLSTAKGFIVYLGLRFAVLTLNPKPLNPKP